MLPVARSSLIMASSAVKMKHRTVQRKTFAICHPEQRCHLKIFGCSHFPRFLNTLNCLLDKMGRHVQKYREFVPQILENTKMGNNQA